MGGGRDTQICLSVLPSIWDFPPLSFMCDIPSTHASELVSTCLPKSITGTMRCLVNRALAFYQVSCLGYSFWVARKWTHVWCWTVWSGAKGNGVGQEVKCLPLTAQVSWMSPTGQKHQELLPVGATWNWNTMFFVSRVSPRSEQQWKPERTEAWVAMGDTDSMWKTQTSTSWWAHFPAVERVKEEGMLAVGVSVPS